MPPCSRVCLVKALEFAQSKRRGCGHGEGSNTWRCYNIGKPSQTDLLQSYGNNINALCDGNRVNALFNRLRSRPQWTYNGKACSNRVAMPSQFECKLNIKIKAAISFDIQSHIVDMPGNLALKETTSTCVTILHVIVLSHGQHWRLQQQTADVRVQNVCLRPNWSRLDLGNSLIWWHTPLHFFIALAFMAFACMAFCIAFIGAGAAIAAAFSMAFFMAAMLHKDRKKEASGHKWLNCNKSIWSMHHKIKDRMILSCSIPWSHTNQHH